MVTFEESMNSPKVGRISIDVLPRSDLMSNFANATPSLSVVEEKVSPMNTDVAFPVFKAGISGGDTTLEVDIMPLDVEGLWTILMCRRVPESDLLWRNNERRVSSATFKVNQV